MVFTVQEASIFGYLIDIIGHFIRQHHDRARYFVLQNNIAHRVLQLLQCPEKYLRLGEFSLIYMLTRDLAYSYDVVAIRFVRQLIALQDGFYTRHIIERQCLGLCSRHVGCIRGARQFADGVCAGVV